MQIFIDADGCPVVGIAINAAKKHGVPVTLVSDPSHQFSYTDVRVITVTKGADSADFRIVNMITAQDLVITQDYGLAAMCLARGAAVMNQDGKRYTPENIDSLLAVRHIARKARNAGTRMKGPAKRTGDQDRMFLTALESLLLTSSESR